MLLTMESVTIRKLIKMTQRITGKKASHTINPSRLGNVTLYLYSGCGDCMQLNPDILLSLSGLMVSQPLSRSVGRGFESQR